MSSQDFTGLPRTWSKPALIDSSEKPLPNDINIKPFPIYQGIESQGDPWMTMACQVATDSVANGGGPFGAVILRVEKNTHRIIEYWKNNNHTQEWSDPTAHAEVSTIRMVCRDLADRFKKNVYHLDNIVDPETSQESFAVIYSSCEPCPMCYSAVCWANIPYLMFSATRFDAAEPGVDFSDADIYQEFTLAYPERKLTKVLQASSENSLEAFENWKNGNHETY
jgi:tRNA(Arg) A34 adenosine deaminase TadA